MAKKIKDEVKEAVEAVEEVIEQVADVAEAVADVVVEEVKEAVEAVTDFAEGAQVEIKDFYVRAYNGIRGFIKSISAEGIEIELGNGAKAVFKEDNLQKVK